MVTLFFYSDHQIFATCLRYSPIKTLFFIAETFSTVVGWGYVIKIEHFSDSFVFVQSWQAWHSSALAYQLLVIHIEVRKIAKHKAEIFYETPFKIFKEDI